MALGTLTLIAKSKGPSPWRTVPPFVKEGLSSPSEVQH